MFVRGVTCKGGCGRLRMFVRGVRGVVGGSGRLKMFVIGLRVL